MNDDEKMRLMRDVRDESANIESHVGPPNPRFWCDNGQHPQDIQDGLHDVEGWYGVVDEKRGGIIAYFGDMDQADAFVAMLNTTIAAAKP